MNNVVYLNNRKTQRKPEVGAAGVYLKLSKSVITMRHCETKKILYRFEAQEGEWSEIIAFIRSFGNAA